MILKRIFPLLLLLFCSTTKAQFSGNALDFDGSNDMVVVSTVPAFFSTLGSSDFTIEAWVNPRGSVFARIFFAQPSATNFVSFGTGAGNVIYFYVIVNGTTYSVATTAAITQNAWTHVAGRWTSATNTPQVFFNGVLQAGAAGGGSSSGTNGLMTLGTRPGGFQYFNGGMDEVRLWSQARTACEINSNMNRSITGVQPNLVVNYDFNQGAAGGANAGVTSLPDLSGNSYNGTLTNFTLSGATSNWITSGATVNLQGSPVGGVTLSQNAGVCSGGSLTFPDGSTQNNITVPFNQVSTIPGPGGCDTTITTMVAVNPVYSVNDSDVVCNGGNYTFPDGVTQTNIVAPVMHTSNLLTTQGCDSAITTYLSISQPTSTNEAASICEGGSYTFPDGTTQSNITSQVMHTSTLQNGAGCDSLVVTTVDVNPVDSMSEAAAVCAGGSYTFPDGVTQNNILVQLVHTSVLQSSLGCDSLVITTVNVNPAYSMNDSASVCMGGSYTFPDATTQNNITSTVVHTSQFSSAPGCDSLVITTVTVTPVDIAVSLAGSTLTASAAGATYQWLDCGNSFAPIAGETSQNFTPASNGNYAVAVTENGCTDTSACTTVNINANDLASPGLQIRVYPNPARDVLNVDAGNSTFGWVELIDLAGSIVRSDEFRQSVFSLDMNGLAKGMYLLRLTSSDGSAVIKVLKE